MKLHGTTILLADVSESMPPSRITRWGGRYARLLVNLIEALRSDCDLLLTTTFDARLAAVKPLQGAELEAALFATWVHTAALLAATQTHTGRERRNLAGALDEIRNDPMGYHDRLILVTGSIPATCQAASPINRGYVLNVALDSVSTNFGAWHLIDSGPEAVVDCIVAAEARAGHWSAEYFELVEACEQRGSQLTDWERKYIATIRSQLERGSVLSVEQTVILNDIREKATRRG